MPANVMGSSGPTLKNHPSWVSAALPRDPCRVAAIGTDPAVIHRTNEVAERLPRRWEHGVAVARGGALIREAHLRPRRADAGVGRRPAQHVVDRRRTGLRG